MFDWVPIYKQIAERVLQFENRQGELIELIKTLRSGGLKVIKVDDQGVEGHITLTEIDPFTFFSSFNRGQSADTRRGVLARLKKEWDLEAAVPLDFEGVPVVNNYQSWFFAYQKDRKSEDIPKLWELAKEGVNKTADTFRPNLLQECISIENVELPKLTMGLFWMSPDKYLSVDSRNRPFFEKRGFTTPKDAKSYFKFLKDVADKLGNDFPSLSRQAYLESMRKSSPPDAPPSQRITVPESQRKYWWLNANPNIWNFEDLPVGRTQTYTSYSKTGHKRQKYKYFGEVKPGDIVVGYVTTPQREVIAVCEITKGLYTSSTGERIEFKKIEQLSDPITYEELKSNPALSSSEPLINNQGSLFALTEDEYEVIRAIIDEKQERKPGTYVKDYDKSSALSELFISEEKLDTIVRRLRRKKNIVLQGAPGVGKTFLAKRLAYLVIGSKDERRVELVQFHQSYSYEDFVQGFRPLATGGFAIKPGVFYEFCRRAQRDSDNDYFFIIDEINRGNLSKIFGELMLLLEHDKRGKEFAVPLAYSQTADDRFYIPDNLYFIGTMNTADRSLSIVDYALRRRFSFITLQPQFGSVGFTETLRVAGTSQNLISKIQQRMTMLNTDISSDTRNLGVGFVIGHSYFSPSEGIRPDETWYRDVIESEIQPLLEEYWIDAPEKVDDIVSQLLE